MIRGSVYRKSVFVYNTRRLIRNSFKNPPSIQSKAGLTIRSLIDHIVHKPVDILGLVSYKLQLLDHTVRKDICH